MSNSKVEIENFELYGVKYFRYQYSVLEMCEVVHSFVTGSANYWEPLTPYVAAFYLKERLKNWRAAKNIYDAAVRKLILAAVDEFVECKNSPTFKEVDEFMFRNPSFKPLFYKPKGE